MNKLKPIILIIFICCIQHILVFGQHNNSLSEQRITQIDSLFKDWSSTETPGGVVMVMKDGELVFSKGYGMSNLEYNIPNDPNNTRFHIASVTKQITAFCIYLLADEQRLSIQDDIRKYIPQLPDYGHTITLDHLMKHTSGLPEEIHLLRLAGYRMDDIFEQNDILRLIKSQENLIFNPNEKHRYNNSGYTLLATVVEKVSGLSFSDFVHQRILEPLEMDHSFLVTDYKQIQLNRSYSFLQKKDGTFEKGISNYYSYGPHGLYTTANDFAKWAANFNNPKVGSAEIFAQMEKVAILNNGRETTAAAGQFLGHYSNVKNFWHQGLDIGYGAYFLRFPKNDLAVAVFTNVNAAPVVRLALGTVDILWDDYFPPVENNSDEIADPEDEPEQKKDIKYAKLSEKEIKAFCNKYWSSTGYFEREIKLENDTLRYVRTNGSSSPLMPLDNSTLVMLVNGEKPKLQFQKNAVGTMDFEYESSNWNGSFIVKGKDENLGDKTGNYYCEDLGTSYSVVVMNDQLTLRHIRNPNFTLEAISKNIFYNDEFFIEQVTFEIDAQGNVTGFTIDNTGARNVYFKKLE